MARHRCKWFRPANPGAWGTRAAYSDAMPPAGISGVYAIARLSGEVLYVGESHTGRLRATLIRHFQTWNDPTQPRAVYDRHRVQVCWLQTSAAEALDTEADWMDWLQPRDNLAAPLEAGYPAEYDDEDLDYEPAAAADEVPF